MNRYAYIIGMVLLSSGAVKGGPFWSKPAQPKPKVLSATEVQECKRQVLLLKHHMDELSRPALEGELTVNTLSPEGRYRCAELLPQLEGAMHRLSNVTQMFTGQTSIEVPLVCGQVSPLEGDFWFHLIGHYRVITKIACPDEASCNEAQQILDQFHADLTAVLAEGPQEGVESDGDGSETP